MLYHETDSYDLPALQRQDPTETIRNWYDWVQWITSHYEVSQKEIAKKIGCSAALISKVKNGDITPSATIMLSLASYSVDRGPRPPKFLVPGPLCRKLAEYFEEHK